MMPIQEFSNDRQIVYYLLRTVAIMMSVEEFSNDRQIVYHL